jgi:dihydrofolate synthase/folylpolyglutamate synthase
MCKLSIPARADENRGQREAAMRFLFDRIDYERMRTMPYDPSHMGLDRMRDFLRRLGNPERGLPIVHVAGTKGKGSTAAMIAGILTAAGYRTGLFTSPHLERLEERMAVDGHLCPAEELVELVRMVRPAVEGMDANGQVGSGKSEFGSAGVAGPDAQSLTLDTSPSTPHAPSSVPQGPTYFEITTALALLHFARAKVDAAVLEVGLGGRLDATNVCTPQLAVITSISFDHTQQLGNTLAAIAGEKAGIVKPGVPVVSGVTAEEPREVVRRICRERDARLIELGQDFDFEYQPPHHLEQAPAHGQLDFVSPLPPAPHSPPFTSYAISLPGRHQATNAALALATVEELRRAGWSIPETAVRHALADLHWPARVEVVARCPTVVLDAAHNVASIEALAATIDESFSAQRRLLIFATTQDKDLRGMLRCLLGRFDEVFFTRYLNNPRAVPPQELDVLAAELTGRHCPVYIEPSDAWDAVLQRAQPQDLVCVTGSFFIAAEMRRQLEAKPFPREVPA